MTQTQKKRLLKLYDHMRQPQRNLAHKKFNFGKWNGGVEGKNVCGTNGCMGGELPAIFKSWHWDGSNIKHSKDIKISEFFGLTPGECQHLFIPFGQSIEIDPKSHVLGSFATKKEVVSNLKRFLKLKHIL